ncbi:MAG: hypothetical protein ACLFQ5_09770 [Oceanicaulis sp.]
MSMITLALIFYIVLQLAIAVWASRKIAGDADYLVAGPARRGDAGDQPVRHPLRWKMERTRGSGGGAGDDLDRRLGSGDPRRVPFVDRAGAAYALADFAKPQRRSA